ncbi:succinate dehydrogenase cytochrome b558 subunit [Siminovitchia sp. FSL H7-0308]|uniref:Succinate dehydrogenase / fumarate reductase cytochrome b subunit n=1 Tax=Siminovitchia thermophila TaxID=1245522 RepID=A0ABS2R577_9BACI|nr:succinate dehydrogenase cytochrome b558 subunit [Siminovitchia thermophila]MBM7714743.1 succinate dehydrogenase / fumarate reductase cytochrome b subunit [Siminovitchia thermophila]ONK24486.1 succinate dehydrogenase [Bacillus sp. VT-16-64]
MAGKNEFYWRRLHSLLGVIPVGVFLVQHLFINHFATMGEEAFNRAAGFVGNLPFVIILEFVVIYIPLLFHAILGIYIAFTADNNPVRLSFFRNWMFTLQRISGIILLLFISWHVWETRIQKALGAEVNFQMMEDILSNPIMLIIYIIGILSATFHLSNGLWSFLVRWGITQSPRSQYISSWVMGVFFVILSVIGIRAALAFVPGFFS